MTTLLIDHDTPYYRLMPNESNYYAWLASRPAHLWATWGTDGERQALDALYGALLLEAVRLPYAGHSAREIAAQARQLALEAGQVACLCDKLEAAGADQP